MRSPNHASRKNLQLWISILTLSLVGIQSCRLKINKKQTHNLTPLLQQLDTSNWRAADAETLRLLLSISDRTAHGWLSPSDIATLDCNLLVKIDQAWTTHSQGRFGFNQQRLIWQSVGGTVGQYTPEIAEKFGDRVGWRRQGQWKKYGTLNFSSQAPNGHLPATTGNGVSGSVWGGVATLSQRFQYCRHEIAISQARQDYYAICDRNPDQQHCRLKDAAERWGETQDWGNTGIPTLLNQLEQSLAQQQWIAADKITRTLLDRYRRANFAEFGSSASHELIPCYLLQATDELWTHYSQGHFGLSAQDQVLASLKHAKLNSVNPTVSRREALGWPQRQSSEQYNPSFDQVAPQQVPKGYYPYDMGYSYGTYGSGYSEAWRFNLNPTCGFQTYTTSMPTG
ncbi:GUN4 domain-containing protein [Leptolyngbya cf. ectocarpi LEGE 11479]|uniref:GUN4 domain-containing protein n=1 Tax=Leptolyngbya cf. ectocarpi LEGE 11479 TaxID=1828722 RepID=A0A928WZT7_LEPEC|nr:GUN4 domain-containing protein [Leptolyngbya ectocarpi]MBE9065867.1 GUN4 domain-containing protein [Leptolyngbya cf. ectocarpi LEGE 11479]